MKIDSRKLDLAMANAQTRNVDIAQTLNLLPGVVASQLGRARRGGNLLPRTVGRIAEAIGCRVEDIITDEAGKCEGR